ncbi:MAG: hypothetical protein BECKG1743D_GA0114223_100463 [Candidatus Kentron sp. G]|nr:MAG: hypothetical protein BECKG1743E_GA0114224_100422 [Candidatus Kentron sp. G]VFM97111.1 MAG: hypothetical protein BECKG1743F_GA0114225_102212 [Candidatus Kentron sp. G]VFM98122.1 MAG: hypothetical protein BECKG1743D_GA0114223_100463 [Candidatus Kentron sp. G]
MLENDIFEQWLSDEADRVLVKLKKNEPLSQDDKLIIVLKGQMNHFHHLDVELRQEMHTLRQEMHTLRQDMHTLRQDMERRFEVVTDEIKQIYKVINTQTWKMIGAVGLIVLLGKLIENF